MIGKKTMYRTITIDLETIPTQREDVREYIAKGIQPPATYKLADSIAKWHKEQGPAAIEEAVSRTGLDGAFGQVVCIGYQLDDMEDPFVMHGLNERDLLNSFSKMLNECIDQKDAFTTSVIGHNVSAFDLRFLMQRYIVNGIRPPFVINRAAQAKPWESDKVFDTMVQFAGPGNRISLEKLCLALSVPTPKSEMNGSMVGQYVADGRIKEVADYCKKDVAATRKCYELMTFQHDALVEHIQSVCEVA